MNLATILGPAAMGTTERRERYLFIGLVAGFRSFLTGATLLLVGAGTLPLSSCSKDDPCREILGIVSGDEAALSLPREDSLPCLRDLPDIMGRPLLVKDVEIYEGRPEEKVRTRVHLEALEVTKACVPELHFTLTQSFVALRAGEVIRLGYRSVVRHLEGDISRTLVVRAEDGRIRFAYVSGARPEYFDSEPLDGMKLRITKENVCADPSGDQHSRAEIGTPQGETCELTPGQNSCCNVWARRYEIQTLDSGLTTSPAGTFESASFLIHEYGLVLPANKPLSPLWPKLPERACQ